MSNSYGTTYYSEAYNNREHQQNLKYKKKLKKLKKLIKDIVIVSVIFFFLIIAKYYKIIRHFLITYVNYVTVQENAALCDEVSRMQENLVVVKEERLMLLKRLCQVQGEIDPALLCAKSGSPGPNSDTVTSKKSVKKRNSIETNGIL